MKQKDLFSSATEHLLQQITALWPALKGSLAEVRKPCIRPNCRACASGQKHPNYLLAYSDKGKRRCMYVPQEMVPVLQQALDNGRRIEQLLFQMGPLLLREYRARNPTQTGPAARLARQKVKKAATKS